MSKDSIVVKMVQIVEKHNLEAMQGSGMDVTAIDAMVNHVRPQIFKIQLDVLETLEKEGLIVVND